MGKIWRLTIRKGKVASMILKMWIGVEEREVRSSRVPGGSRPWRGERAFPELRTGSGRGSLRKLLTTRDGELARLAARPPRRAFRWKLPNKSLRGVF